MEPLSKNFTPEPTRQANLAKANHWLDKAVQFESDGKSANMVNLALNKACDYENAATE